VAIGLALIIVAAIAAICFIALLIFLIFAINKTGGTACMGDIAKVLRAYRVPLPMWRGRNRE
jgi:uncharacterized protein YoxC